MFLILLVLLTALTISGVAIYYSVSGLIAIFAAAPFAIAVMGGALEIGKLVTALWLHKYWRRAKTGMKVYLSTAVIILMFITSMGIFGFLSKAHIEQTSASTESVAQVQRIETEIARQTAIITRTEEKIIELESKNVRQDETVQEKIDREQERINLAYERIQPAINEQNAIVAQRQQLYKDQITAIDAELAALQSYINSNDIKRAQGMIGAKQDGVYGPNTARLFSNFKEKREMERTTLFSKLEQSSDTDSAIIAARQEIQRLRGLAETQIANSTQLINNLRVQLAQQDTVVDEQAIVDNQLKITEANNIIDKLTEEKYTIEAEYRKLEAEVGPIKYVAEFIYSDNTNANTLEEAVRWMIIIIIFVFDPLAVLLLIASQQALEFRREDKHGANNNVSAMDTIMDGLGLQNTSAKSVQSESTNDDEFPKDYVYTDDEKDRKEEYEYKELNDVHWRDAKHKWKFNNPNETLKSYKQAYIQGKIDKLPWENAKR